MRESGTELTRHEALLANVALDHVPPARNIHTDNGLVRVLELLQHGPERVPCRRFVREACSGSAAVLVRKRGGTRTKDTIENEVGGRDGATESDCLRVRCHGEGRRREGQRRDERQLEVLALLLQSLSQYSRLVDCHRMGNGRHGRRRSRLCFPASPRSRERVGVRLREGSRRNLP